MQSSKDHSQHQY